MYCGKKKKVYICSSLSSRRAQKQGVLKKIKQNGAVVQFG
jgi:hypothetical protein